MGMGWATAAAMTNVPILLYHSVSENPSAGISRYAVTPETFARQLDAVVASGSTALTISEYAEALDTGMLHEIIALQCPHPGGNSRLIVTLH